MGVIFAFSCADWRVCNYLAVSGFCFCDLFATACCGAAFRFLMKSGKMP